jgi:hypothetical protein
MKGDAKMFGVAVSYLRTLRPHLRLKTKIMVSAGLLCFGCFPLASLAYRAGRPLEPIARKLLSA